MATLVPTGLGILPAGAMVPATRAPLAAVHVVAAHAIVGPSHSPNSAILAKARPETGSTTWFPGGYPGTYNFIDTTSCWAPGDCLGVGSTAFADNGPTSAVLFSGGVVSSAVPPPLPSGEFGFETNSLDCLSASWCMLADGATGTSTPIWMWNGSSWSSQSASGIPSGTELGQMSCASTSLCVAVGWAMGGLPVVEEFNGSSWSPAPLPSSPPSTSGAVATAVSCSGTFCMAGPVAQDSSGHQWMSVLSDGTWSDSEITGITPSGSSNYVVGSLSCPSAGNCEIGVTAPATTTPGFVPFESDTWGALQPAADGGSVFPAISCLSMNDCTAAVIYGNASELQDFDGTAWSGVPGTSTPGGDGTAFWLALSCPISGSCLASGRGGWIYETAPLPTSVTVSVRQTGPFWISLAGNVNWPVLSTASPIPTVTYEFDGQPIDGCAGLSPNEPTSGSPIPTCSVQLSAAGPYSFQAAVDPGPYFQTARSPTTAGTLTGAYWEVGSDGSIYPFGSADNQGSLQGLPLNKPIVGGALTADAEGYWLVASDGGLFAFGDAPFYGSMGGKPLNKPIVGMATTPDGGGYWLVASDGGLFAFGDAPFYGSTGGRAIPAPVVTILGLS
jgi:hypothetical protein